MIRHETFYLEIDVVIRLYFTEKERIKNYFVFHFIGIQEEHNSVILHTRSWEIYNNFFGKNINIFFLP